MMYTYKLNGPKSTNLNIKKKKTKDDFLMNFFLQIVPKTKKPKKIKLKRHKIDTKSLDKERIELAQHMYL